MIKMKMDKKSVKDFVSSLKKISRSMDYHAHEAVVQAAEKVANLSNRYVPIYTGALSGSLYVMSEITEDGPRVYVGYGGDNIRTNPLTGIPTTFYDVRVHEGHVKISKESKAMGRNMKFLELPINEMRIGYAAFLQEYMSLSLSMSSQKRILTPKPVKKLWDPPIITLQQKIEEEERQERERQERRERRKRR